MDVILGGIAMGCVYALLAASFAVVLRSTSVLNLSVIGMFVLAPFVLFELTSGSATALPLFVLAVLAVGVAIGLLSTATEAVFIRPLSNAPFDVQVIATLSINTIVLTLINVRRSWSFFAREVGSPFPGRQVQLLGTSVPLNNVVLVLFALVVLGGVMLLVERTRAGLAFQAVAIDREAAASLGVSFRRVVRASWFLAGFLAAVGGCLLGMSPRLVEVSSLPAVAFRALPAAVIGGILSVSGAAIGGVIVGVCEALVARWAPSFFGTNPHYLASYTLMVAVLMFSGEGLIARRSTGRA